MKIKKIKKLVSNLLIKNYTPSKVKKSTKLRIRIEKKKIESLDLIKEIG